MLTNCLGLCRAPCGGSPPSAVRSLSSEILQCVSGSCAENACMFLSAPPNLTSGAGALGLRLHVGLWGVVPRDHGYLRLGRRPGRLQLQDQLSGVNGISPRVVWGWGWGHDIRIPHVPVPLPCAAVHPVFLCILVLAVPHPHVAGEQTEVQPSVVRTKALWCECLLYTVPALGTGNTAVSKTQSLCTPGATGWRGHGSRHALLAGPPPSPAERA